MKETTGFIENVTPPPAATMKKLIRSRGETSADRKRALQGRPHTSPGRARPPPGGGHVRGLACERPTYPGPVSPRRGFGSRVIDIPGGALRPRPLLRRADMFGPFWALIVRYGTHEIEEVPGPSSELLGYYQTTFQVEINTAP